MGKTHIRHTYPKFLGNFCIGTVVGGVRLDRCTEVPFWVVVVKAIKRRDWMDLRQQQRPNKVQECTNGFHGVTGEKERERRRVSRQRGRQVGLIEETGDLAFYESRIVSFVVQSLFTHYDSVAKCQDFALSTCERPSRFRGCGVVVRRYPAVSIHVELDEKGSNPHSQRMM